MRRPQRWAALLAACLSVTAPKGALAEQPVIARAGELLDRDDAPGAIALLEPLLPVADASDRPEVIRGLRRAYALAAEQAEAAGKADQARVYRDNLAILDRKAKPRPKPSPPSAPPSGPTDAPPPLLPPSETKPDAPEPASTGVREPGSIEAAAPAPARAPKPPAVPEATRPSPPEPEPAAPARADDGRCGRLDAADAAWVAKRYAEAGKLYAGLAAAGPLPGEAAARWRYCRLQAVKDRINANPRSAAEWAAIRAEIDRVRAEDPSNWVAEYLRNVTAQRSGLPPTTDPRRRVLRGASPEDPPARPRQPLRDTPMDQPVANLKKIAWAIKRTENFTIWHTDPALADRVAKAAEAARTEQTRRWTGAEPKSPWAPRCNIVLFPDVRSFVDATGQAESSPGFSTIDLRNGRVGERFIKLRANADRLVDVVLPHEVTHVVLADLFPSNPIPRWADEGMAILAEPDDAQRRRSDLSAAFAANRLFSVAQILTANDYPPDSHHWPLYHAQSVSITRFLVDRDGPRPFVEFLRASQAEGLDPALRRVYKIDGLAHLQRLWLADCRRADAAVASRPPSASQTR